MTFKVSVPKVEDKPEWNLKGQTVSFTLPLTDTVRSRKDFQLHQIIQFLLNVIVILRVSECTKIVVKEFTF